MKKLFPLLVLFGFVFTACEGGDGVEEENGGTPFVPEITISPEELSFPVEGGEEEVTITANFDYEVSERTDWLSVEQTEVGLLVKVDKSERTESRYADIVITNKDYEIEKYVTVSQAAFEPSITIKPLVVTFTAGGGEQEVIITSNVEYEVSERASWLSVEQTETGLIVVADESKNTSERTAYISISNEKYSITKTIDIVQEAWVPKIELSQQSVEVEFEPAEYEVAVTSPYSWEATTKNDWIVVESETGIAGTKTLKFSVARNEEEDIREGTIVVKNEDYNLVAELYITQKAFVPAITIEPETLTFAVEGGTQEIAITANFEYEFSTTADWLTIEKSDKGISVTAPNYVEVDERTAEITISSEKYGISKVVNVTQGAFVPAITIEPESLAFTSEGGTQEIAITANFEYAYSANADWLTIEKSESRIKVTAQNNVEVDERTAEITISSEKYGISKVVNVMQGAFVPAITIEPESLIFTFEGGTQEIAITANFEYEVSANADWLTIEKRDKGVNISATPNTKFKECTAEITISNKRYNISKTISVVQKGVSAEPQNVIIYTSSDGKIVTPYNTNVFGANIVSNIYSNVHGQGIIIFDAPVTSIGENAFYNCRSLKSVTIPDSVTSIGQYAFYGCTSLKEVYCKSTTPSAGGSSMFYMNASGRKIYVPASSVKAYRSAAYWKEYYIVGYDFENGSVIPDLYAFTLNITIKGTRFNGILVDVVPSDENVIYALNQCAVEKDWETGAELEMDWMSKADELLSYTGTATFHQGALTNHFIKMNPSIYDWYGYDYYVYGVPVAATSEGEDWTVTQILGYVAYVKTTIDASNMPSLEWDLTKNPELVWNENNKRYDLEVVEGSTVVLHFNVINPVEGAFVTLNGNSLYDSFNVVDGEPVIDNAAGTITLKIDKFDTAKNYHYVNPTFRYTNADGDTWGITTPVLRLTQVAATPAM